MQVGAGHARVLHVADNHHLQLREVRALGLAQGQHVQQALGRVRAAAVTGIDQRGALARRFSQCGDGAIIGVAHHEAAHAHRFQVAQRVAGGFALARGRGRGIEVQHVGTQALRGQLERAAGAGGRFEEQRAYRRTGQHVALVADAADRGVADLPGAIEQLQQGFARQPLKGQQVAQASGGIDLLGGHGGSRAVREWGWRRRETTASDR
ncbi:hypothetical protein G6F50_015332 [Rhizopus delemar]|uniref:Uncharacterized protein n=1 Tax=Rhizopus delemar TaxID=936053 RepID=A0A9P7C4X9_9FUNG|nr:hypothetical protein G6F50_015332 [Rhizopus delemar]